jgi:transposase
MSMIRIRVSKATVNQLITALQKAYKSGDARMIKRINVLLDFSRNEAIETIAQHHEVSTSAIYEWIKKLLVEGVAGLKPKWKGGRPAKLTPRQKKRLSQLIEAGPQAAGFRTACWNSAIVQELIQREFNKVYNVHYVCELLKNLGFSFQKARFVSDHLDEAQRLAWLQHTWPTFRAQAEAANGLLLFGDESGFAQWGSLSYTWARKGKQPVVKTSGKRHNYKVFGLIDFFSGQLFYQGTKQRLNSESYLAFLAEVLKQTTAPIFLVQDGAKYHTSKKTRRFFEDHADRLTVTQLPSYSPDYNPIEYLWRAVKKEATHLKYFPTFDSLVEAVEVTMTGLKTKAEYVKGLFTLYLKEMQEETETVLAAAA